MRRRLPLGLLVPAALVVLVGALATLQYRWLGQVSEAERDELRSSLERRAAEFADDFDREITRAYSTFQDITPASEPNAPPSLAKAIDAWRSTSRFPSLVKEVYFVRTDAAQEPGPSLMRYANDRDTFEAMAWPPSLEPVRDRLMPSLDRLLPAPVATAARGQFITITGTTVVNDIPALVVPVVPHRPTESFTASGTVAGAGGRMADVFVAMRVPHDYLVLVLDRQVIAHDMLPALVDRHFDSTRYRVAVLDNTSTPVITRGLPKDGSIDPARADVSSPLFTVRPELAREGKMIATYTASTGAVVPRASAAPPGAGRATPGDLSVRIEQRSSTVTQGLRVSRNAWLVLLQHSAGSLDAAVTAARHRNLWLSFGILSVLMASVGLIVLNARRSERLAAQQMDFVATVSHELRTPVTVIRSAAQNLSAGVVHDAEQARRYGDLIEVEGRRLTDMVEQVLEFAGLSANRRTMRAEPGDIGASVRETLEACAPLLEAEQCQLDVKIAPDLPPVLLDEEAFRRALQNLLVNAVKHAADGRWIGVAVSVAATGARHEVQVAVSDHGRGIEPAELPHLFEPFYRGRYAVDRQIHGNGLGLSVVERIAEAHGGRVTVKSVVGQGSTFTLHLPAVAPGTAAAVPAPTPSNSGGPVV